jgi:hypothetical protein
MPAPQITTVPRHSATSSQTSVRILHAPHHGCWRAVMHLRTSGCWSPAAALHSTCLNGRHPVSACAVASLCCLLTEPQHMPHMCADLGWGARPFDASGDSNLGTHCAMHQTFWNVRARMNMLLPQEVMRACTGHLEAMLGLCWRPLSTGAKPRLASAHASVCVGGSCAHRQQPLAGGWCWCVPRNASLDVTPDLACPGLPGMLLMQLDFGPRMT